jgi:hypothetical protein
VELIAEQHLAKTKARFGLDSLQEVQKECREVQMSCSECVSRVLERQVLVYADLVRRLDLENGITALFIGDVFFIVLAKIEAIYQYVGRGRENPIAVASWTENHTNLVHTSGGRSPRQIHRGKARNTPGRKPCAGSDKVT